MRTVFTLPLLIRSDEEYNQNDLDTLNSLAYSLRECEDYLLIIYNQGSLDDNYISGILSSYNINNEIIGTGSNIGIPKARQIMFEYIWENHPEVDYISELHLDMIFTKNWHLPIVKWLDEHIDEPMCSPGVITAQRHYYIDPAFKFDLPKSYDELIEFMNGLSSDTLIEGLVHPTIHRSSTLKEISGIDIRFFKSKQGYEDYSILLGYRYWTGISKNWKPKIYGKSTVYHAVAQQRWTLNNAQKDIAINGEGLFYQYGSYGLRELSIILGDEEYMGALYRQRVKYFESINFQ